VCRKGELIVGRIGEKSGDSKSREKLFCIVRGISTGIPEWKRREVLNNQD
jgi:hypothetical protein